MAVPSLKINNPGNIRPGAKLWEGEVRPSYHTEGNGDFAVFKTMDYGVRAQAKILLTYQNKYGLNTIRKIINRYAPSSENDTSAYVLSVSKQTGIAPDTIIDLNNAKTLAAILKAQHKVEHGFAVNISSLSNGVLLALGKKKDSDLLEA